jgi:hypothetical protein
LARGPTVAARELASQRCIDSPSTAGVKTVSSVPVPQEPIDREIVHLVSELSTHWSPVDEQHLSSTATEALTLIVRAGMAEGRLRLRLQMDGRPETSQVRLCVSGEYNGREVFAKIAPHLPNGWLDAGGRTQGRLQVKSSGYREARLTDQGELARQNLDHGQVERVVSFVRKTGFFQSRPDVPSSIRIENMSTQSRGPETSGDDAGRVVALAQASVGDIDIQVTPTIHVHPTVHVHLDEVRNDTPDRPAEARNPPLEAEPQAAWVYARDGNGYYVAGCGERGHVSGLVGFRHIESLLQQAGRPVSMVTLVGGPMADESEAGPRSRQPALGQAARDRIRDQLREYDEEIAEAESDGRAGEAALLRDEKEALSKALLADLGLGGQARDANSPRRGAAVRRPWLGGLADSTCLEEPRFQTLGAVAARRGRFAVAVQRPAPEHRSPTGRTVRLAGRCRPGPRTRG